VFATSRISSKLARLSVLGIAVGSLAGGFVILEGASPAGASGTLYVSPYGSDAGGNPCTSSAAPCLTLQHAYNEAGTGTTTIELAGGTYQGNFGVTVATGVRHVEKNLDIVGADNGGSLNVNTSTITGGSELTAVATQAGFTVNLTDLVANDGTSSAVSNHGTMTLTDVAVGADAASSLTYDSAGVDNGGTLKMVGGSISGNFTSTFGGGGLYNYNSGTTTLDNVSITHNEATASYGEGGGIFNLSGKVHLDGTTALHDNSATVDGGGIENCKSNGAVVTFGSGVVDTANTPNDYSTADPEGDCV
jgi:hypothetical protein